MAVSGKIADGIIKIALAGYEQVKANLVQLQTQVSKISTGLQGIGAASAAGFAGATGGILGLLKAADPVRFTIFTQKLEILAMYMGDIFIPILQDAINWLDKLINFFKNLTPEQQDQIEHWTRIGLVVLAAGTALATLLAVGGKVIGLVQSLSAVIGGLGTAVKLLMSSTGLGLVVALAAAAFGIYELLKATGKLDPVIKVLQDLFAKFGEAVGPIFEKVAAAFQPVIEAVGQFLGSLGPVLAQVAAAFGQLFQAVAPILAQLATEVGGMLAAILPQLLALGQSLVKELLPPLMQVGQAFGQLLVQAIPPLVQIGAAVLKLYALWYTTLGKLFLTLISAVLPVLSSLLTTLAGVLEAVTPAVTVLAEAFGSVLGVAGQLVGGVLGALVKILGSLLGVLGGVATKIIDAFGPAIVSGIKVIASVIETVAKVIEKIVKAMERAAEIADALNPFSSSDDDKKKKEAAKPSKPRTEEEKAGDAGFSAEFEARRKKRIAEYAAGDHTALTAHFAEDFGAAVKAREAAVAEFRKKTAATPEAGGAEGEGKTEGGIFSHFGKAVSDLVKGGKSDPHSHTPLPRPVKVESFGLEEAFRKAQTGASFDPAKLADHARAEREGKMVDLLGSIDTKVTPASPALSAI